VLENWYDAGSHRVAKAEMSGGSTVRLVYLYDNWDIVGISSGGSGLYETFTRGVALAGDIGGLIAVTRNNQRYYLHNNHRGDITHVRMNNITLSTHRYTAFGQIIGAASSNSRFRFSSKERDPSTGMYYYGYRFYAPQWQRWMSRDPLGELLGINLYRFVWNTPLRIVDSFGLDGTNIGFPLLSVPTTNACPPQLILNIGTFDRGVNSWGLSQPFGLPWSDQAGSITGYWPIVISPCPPPLPSSCQKTNAPSTGTNPPTQPPLITPPTNPPPVVPPPIMPPPVT